MPPTVRRERAREGVDLITLDRPDRLNAINHQLLDDLEEALGQSDRDESCRAVVLTGAGRAFCAGLDLREMTGPDSGVDGSPQALMRHAQNVVRVIPLIRSVRKPTVAAIRGAAAGGGMAMSLACDVRVAAADARFNAAFIKIGVSACDLGLSWILPRLVGASRAFEIMLTGRMIDAAEAERIGLVARVVDDPDAVCEEALATAEAIASNSPFGVWMTKEVMWANLEVGSLAAGIDLENRTQVLGLLTKDHREAVDAFLEKRAPQYQDR
ncbi:MAG TPA: enoyl-CoA hydratase/isomerase family protein [Acidimicrobiales bacterium]|jgi:enoyl-CoA hydratase|nr:enoyl-CoA hydratase/isomerase family protein [Acidimicrobiales bacterium]